MSFSGEDSETTKPWVIFPERPLPSAYSTAKTDQGEREKEPATALLPALDDICSP